MNHRPRTLASAAARRVHRRRNEERLAVRFVQGDPAAIEEIYARHAPDLYATAYRVLGDRDMATEAVQRTLLKAWQHAERFDPERPLAPWLHAICKRTTIDTYRTHRRHPTPVEDVHLTRSLPVVATPDDEPAASQDVRDAIDRLPVLEREVVRFAYVDGLTHGEAAARLGVPVGTIKSRSHRAHRRLANQLGHLSDQRH